MDGLMGIPQNEPLVLSSLSPLLTSLAAPTLGPNPGYTIVSLVSPNTTILTSSFHSITILLRARDGQTEGMEGRIGLKLLERQRIGDYDGSNRLLHYLYFFQAKVRGCRRPLRCRHAALLTPVCPPLTNAAANDGRQRLLHRLFKVPGFP